MSESEKVQSSQYQYCEENLIMERSHIISEMRRITLQIRLFLILMFHLMLWENPTYDPHSVSNILTLKNPKRGRGVN